MLKKIVLGVLAFIIGATGSFLFLPSDIQADVYSQYSGWILGPGGTYTGGAISTSQMVDPIIVNNAAGNIVTTTGSITSGTSLLTVASNTGWAVGMGISVANAGTGGNTQLITQVIGISGTGFTLATNALATATSQTVNHDDTAAINNLIASGKCISLENGANYRITSTLNFNVAGSCMMGVAPANALLTSGSTGFGSNLIWGQATGNMIAITKGYVTLQNFNIYQDQSITPTNGYAIVAGDGTATRIRFLYLNNIVEQGMSGGLNTQNSVSQSIFSNLFLSFYGGTSDPNSGLFINNDSPAGDNFYENLLIGPTQTVVTSGTGINITSADTQFFNNIKVTSACSGILIAAASTKSIEHLKFTNLSVENCNIAGNAAIRIGNNGSSTSDISFVNTHMGSNTSFGVRATGGSNFSFIGGTINSGTPGFSLESGTSNYIISGFNFDAVTTAINVASGASNIHIGKNNYSGVTTNLSNSSNVPIDYDINGSANFTGNVGIGSLAPGQALDVQGTIRATNFINSFVPTNIQVITSSQTWTNTNNVKNIYVKVIGAGGAGAAGFGSGTVGGAGGGGGGYSEGWLAVGATAAVTIGATNSIVGSSVTIQATSGTAGTPATLTVSSIPGAGGTGSGGSINITGGSGEPLSSSTATVLTTGRGGSSAMSEETPGVLVTGGGTGQAGLQYGAGGSGGTLAGSGQPGGAGDPGAVIIYY